ncbi:MAG: dual specificity protein phosphatase family protein [Planctomycetes bacterium]|nr:dual specificity protein phosphatase family protein [Planctomycetota bacterium]
MKLYTSALKGLAIFVLGGCGAATQRGLYDAQRTESAIHRPLAATRVSTSPLLPNVARVDENLFRGGKPKGKGFDELKAMGVKTVIDLGFYFFEIDNLRDADLRYERIPFFTYRPKDSDVARFLRIASDPANGPVYVHCRRGADRTGMMVAMYRVVISGWSKEDAIAEMIGGGFGFDAQYQNLIDYVQNADVAAIAALAGLPTSSS